MRSEIKTLTKRDSAASGMGRKSYFSILLTTLAVIFTSLTVVAPASAAPAITSITPATGSYAGGEDVVIAGSGFVSGSTTVTIGGASATIKSITSDTMTVTTPAGTVGARTVDVVVTGAGAGTASTSFEYIIKPPTTTSISPLSGPTSGGTTLVITGTNLELATGVTIGGRAATLGTKTATSLTVTTPTGDVGNQTIVVTTPGGTASTQVFNYVAAPTVTAISPTSGLETGGTAISITGTNLLGASSVTIGGVAATSVRVVSATNVTAVTPANSVGAKNVVVTTPGGSGTLTNGFTYTAASLITPSTQTYTYTAGVAIAATTTYNATGFSGTVRYEISPAAPAGLSFSTTTGVLTGTPTTNQAATTYTITAIGATSGRDTATISITINARITPATQTYTYAAGTAIAATTTFAAAGFTGTVTYAVSPPLPAGLSLSATTGVITGTPTAAQAATVYTVTATGTTTGSTAGSGSATATITISVGASLAPTTRTLAVTQNQAVSTAAYTATGFVGTITYSVTPALPAGLLLSSATGIITGTPTTISAATNYVITATGATSGTGSTTLTLSVLAPLAAPTGVSATAGNASATVQWNAVIGATSYQVVASPAAGTCAVTGTTATCTGLTNGTKYAFRVTAVNQAGPAALSTLSAQVTPKPPFEVKTGKLTILYSTTGSVVPAASLTRIRAIGAQFRADKGTAAVISVKGFTTKAPTALEKRLAATRATLVAKALRQAGLRGTYTTTGDGVTNRVGAQSRKVVIKYTYNAPN